VEYVEDGRTSYVIYSGYFEKLDAFQPFDRRRLHNLLIKAFKIVNVAQLARLTDAFAARESFMPVESKGIIHVVKEATEKQETDNCGACTSLS
jgi:hypothetical protein